jgi:starch-binding outer membrane protein, SusD/RagB family
VPNKAIIVAEMRTLRAFYYYLLMDFFGGVPIVTTTEVIPREQATRAEVFAFIEKELTEARARFPTPGRPRASAASPRARWTRFSRTCT